MLLLMNCKESNTLMGIVYMDEGMMVKVRNFSELFGMPLTCMHSRLGDLLEQRMYIIPLALWEMGKEVASRLLFQVTL